MFKKKENVLILSTETCLTIRMEYWSEIGLDNLNESGNKSLSTLDDYYITSISFNIMELKSSKQRKSKN